MRVLCTTIPSYGHFHPLVPLARALQQAGHDVTVATAVEFRGPVERAGFPVVPAGLSERAMVAAAAGAWDDDGRSAPERGLQMFAAIAAPAMVDDLLPALERLAIDFVLHEEGEWGAPVAAAAAGIPAFAHGWGTPFWAETELDLVGRLAAPLWQRYGVTPSSPAGLFDHLYIDVCPPALQNPGIQAVRTQPMRFEPFDDSVETQRFHPPPGSAPMVYATLGTVPTFNRAPDVLRAVVAGLADQDLRLIVSTGPGSDPATLDPVGPNVMVTPYVRQSTILPDCALAITHGGAGSTLGALGHSVPVLLLPRGAPSQQRMAEACARAGVGRSLAPDEIRAERLAAEAQVLIEHEAYGRCAQAVAAEIAQLPSPADVAAVLEDLVGSADTKGATR
jgi:UDP:flavonoid glycosyltransferase YjiC (YdhE family)